MATVRGKSCRANKPTASGDRSGHPNVPTDAVFTIDELVIYLKLPKSTIYKLAQEGEIPGHKVGRHWRFRRETIDRWLDQRNEATNEAVE